MPELSALARCGIPPSEWLEGMKVPEVYERDPRFRTAFEFCQSLGKGSCAGLGSRSRFGILTWRITGAIDSSKFRRRLSRRPGRTNIEQMPSLRFQDLGDHRSLLAPGTSGIPHSLAFPGIRCKHLKKGIHLLVYTRAQR